MKNNQHIKHSAQHKTKPKVLFFDVNETLLDLTPLKTRISEVLNGKDELLSMWFTTLLHYSLVTSASQQYKHFEDIGAAALQMVAANNNITISKTQARDTIVKGFRTLPAHPEVKPALRELREAGYTLVAFTNSSNEGVKNQLEFAGLTNEFDAIVSVEAFGKFKPFTETYTWVARKMEVQPEECLLIAAHGWDVGGALWAGWRAAFVKRSGQQLFPLAPKTEIVESDLKKVTDILITYK